MRTSTPAPGPRVVLVVEPGASSTGVAAGACEARSRESSELPPAPQDVAMSAASAAVAAAARRKRRWPRRPGQEFVKIPE